MFSRVFQLAGRQSLTVSPLLRANAIAVNQVQSRGMRPYGQIESDAFRWSGMKRHPAVIPLVALISATICGLCGFILYSANSRENVVFIKGKKTISESMDLLNPEKRKLYIANQQYRPLTEVEKLYKDMDQGTGDAGTNETD